MSARGQGNNMSHRRMGLALAGLVVLSGCGKVLDGGGVNRSDYSRLASSYNALLAEQRVLIASSNKLQVAAQREQRYLHELDTHLVTFAGALEEFYAQVPSGRLLTKAEDESLANIVTKAMGARVKALTALAALEAVLLEEQTAMYANAANVFKDVKGNQEEIRRQEKLFRDRNMQLLGVRNVIALNALQLRRFIAGLKMEGGSAPSAPVPVVPKKIELNERDKEIARGVGKAGGFARDGRGVLVPLADSAAIERHATTNGFNGRAAADGAKMASRTGGAVSFAPAAKDIPKAVVDVIAHIKPQLNTNTDDLELALVIDYSGSMSDKIEATLKGLKEVVESLKNVIASGRNVKVGLVTFGAPGKERIELDFTRNMVVVQQELDRLFREYRTKSHSTDPGEASIHGLEIAAKKLSWKSKNRMAIAITDEPSQEIQQGDTKYVDSVFELLKVGGIQSRIYTIVVK